MFEMLEEEQRGQTDYMPEEQIQAKLSLLAPPFPPSQTPSPSLPPKSFLEPVPEPYSPPSSQYPPQNDQPKPVRQWTESLGGMVYQGQGHGQGQGQGQGHGPGHGQGQEQESYLGYDSGAPVYHGEGQDGLYQDQEAVYPTQSTGVYPSPGGTGPVYRPQGTAAAYPGQGGSGAAYPGQGGSGAAYPGLGGSGPTYPGQGGLEASYPGQGGTGPVYRAQDAGAGYQKQEPPVYMSVPGSFVATGPGPQGQGHKESYTGREAFPGQQGQGHEESYAGGPSYSSFSEEGAYTPHYKVKQPIC